MKLQHVSQDPRSTTVKDLDTGVTYGSESYGSVKNHLSNGGIIADAPEPPAVTQSDKDAQTLPLIQSRILVEERLRLGKLSKHKKAKLSVDADAARLVEIDAQIDAVEAL